MLMALCCVNEVRIFDELTPVKVLDEIQPAIHVKGGDYLEGDLPESNVVKKNGGKIFIFPFIKGYSTTKILKEGTL